MTRIWAAWVLLVAAQITPGLVGQWDAPNPYGHGAPFFAERIPAVAVFGVLILYTLYGFRRAWAPSITAAAAGSALVAALLATPEPSRFAYPAVMAWAQVTVFLHLVAWAASFDVRRYQTMAATVAGMQLLGVGLYVYAQTAIGVVPVPNAALYHLHGPWVASFPTFLGTALLVWASRV
jgi:hypothetical protein